MIPTDIHNTEREMSLDSQIHSSFSIKFVDCAPIQGRRKVLCESYSGAIMYAIGIIYVASCLLTVALLLICILSELSTVCISCRMITWGSFVISHMLPHLFFHCVKYSSKHANGSP